MVKTLELKDPDGFMNTLATNGYSASSFAKHIGINKASISTYVRKTRRASPTTAKKIADGLNIKVMDIFSL